MGCKDRLAERALVTRLAPLLDAGTVEVMPFIAGQRCDHIRVFEVLQADYALFMLRVLVEIDDALELAQRLVSLLLLLVR